MFIGVLIPTVFVLYKFVTYKKLNFLMLIVQRDVLNFYKYFDNFKCNLLLQKKNKIHNRSGVG